MSVKKLPHELTDEELVKQLESGEDTEVIDADTDVLSFVSAFKLSSGDQRVRATIVYKLYKTWSAHPLDSATFSRQLSNIIVREKDWYFLNQDSLFFNKEFHKKKQKKKTYKVKSGKWNLKFQKFLNHYTLSKGPVFIELEFLHWLYSKYVFNSGKKHGMSKHSFAQMCVKYFGKPRVNVSSYYGVSTDIYQHLSPEWVIKFRELRMKQKNERKAKNKKRYETAIRNLSKAYKESYESQGEQEVSSPRSSSESEE